MTTQNYLMINESTNTVENIILWNGNTQTWTPPTGYLMRVQATTTAMIWNAVENAGIITYELIPVVGAGDIGYTWNGTVLTTNVPKPIDVVPSNQQPVSTGTRPA
jgi:hypothetical protein